MAFQDDDDLDIRGYFCGVATSCGESREVAVEVGGGADDDGWHLLAIDAASGQPYCEDGQGAPFLLRAIRAAMRHGSAAGRPLP
jgi:hypothetical protein